MHEKHSEDNGSAISVCAVNYEYNNIQLEFFKLCCLWSFGKCLEVLVLACTPVSDYVSA